MAVHVVSRAAYDRLHYGGIAAMVAGAVLMLAALVAVLLIGERAGDGV
jgi:hypothetical protein